jgi:excisionase family DNA binding protein
VFNSNNSLDIFEPLITASQASGLLQIHPETLRRWAREEKVPYHRLGRKILFRASELNSWLSTVYSDPAVSCRLNPKERQHDS